MENPSRRARELGWVAGGMEEAEEEEEARWDRALPSAPAAGTSQTRLRSSWRGERRAFAWVDILAGVLAVPAVAERFPLFSPC